MIKTELRTQLKNIRGGLSEAERKKLSYQINDHVICSDEFRRAKSVCIYKSFSTEVITDGMIETALSLGKRVALPRICDDVMKFFYYSIHDDLIKSSFGILEPLASAELAEAAELTIVPMLGFNTELYRLGYGGGFYDRFFVQNMTIKKIGVAFDCQLTDKLVADKYDIKMDGVITEKGVYNGGTGK